MTSLFVFKETIAVLEIFEKENIYFLSKCFFWNAGLVIAYTLSN